MSIRRTTTRDLGLAIRDHLEGEAICVNHDDPSASDDDAYEVECVDDADPNNLIVRISDGTLYRVSVVAI